MSDLARLLGFETNARLLLIHADDLGMCHSVNSAIFEAFERGAITSASAMVPCSWFAEAADYACEHPELDIGVHLAVTSEWMRYKWRPVAAGDHTGLVDGRGYFLSNAAELTADDDSLGEELSAQIDLARRAGLSPAHVDSHMYVLLEDRRFFETYLRTAVEKEVLLFLHPKLIEQDWLGSHKADAVLFEAVYEVGHREDPPPASAWLDFYLDKLRSLKPGLNQLTVHPGYDDSELRTITGEKDGWGASWRQRDFNVIISAEFRSALVEQNVQLVNWRQISEAVAGARSLAMRS